MRTGRRVAARGRDGGRARTGRLLLVLVLLAGTGCADFHTPEDPTGGLPDLLIENPSFSAHIAPIFEARCATGGCHSPAGQQADLVLEPSVAYDNIVNVTSTLGDPMALVAPGDAENSWLMRMIDDDPAARGGLSRMPLASTPLTANQVENIRRWIEQGAERN